MSDHSEDSGKEVNGAVTYFDDGQVKLIQGHVLDGLRLIPDESIQCVITSPPY